MWHLYIYMLNLSFVTKSSVWRQVLGFVVQIDLSNSQYRPSSISFITQQVTFLIEKNAMYPPIFPLLNLSDSCTVFLKTVKGRNLKLGQHILGKHMTISPKQVQFNRLYLKNNFENLSIYFDFFKSLLVFNIFSLNSLNLLMFCRYAVISQRKRIIMILSFTEFIKMVHKVCKIYFW